MTTSQQKQPTALFFLFLTELWERFGFYTIQGLLVLYMTQYYRYSDTQSYTVLGIFTALVYISPVFGGFVADKVLGFTTSILWGGLILVIGYAILALSANPLFFYPALAVIIVGNGFFKPNISSLLGRQYTPKDKRRESGFTIFYIGINLGAFLAGVSSGYVKEYIGWQASFALASVGLVIGCLTFMFGLHHFKHDTPHTFGKHPKQWLKLLALSLLATLGTYTLLKIHVLADWMLPISGVGLIALLIFLIFYQPIQFRQHLTLLTLLIVSSLVFWLMYFQLFFSATLYIDRLVDKDVFGLHLSTTVFYASESVFIILLGPAFAWLWHKLEHRHNNPEPYNKFTLGIAFGGLGFLVLAASTYFPNSSGLINPLWIFFAYLLITTGELLLSPIGLSAVTHLAPPNLVGMMMGVWFVATGFGGVLAGETAKIASVPSSVTQTKEMLAIYHHAFISYAYIAFFVAILMFFLRLACKRITSSPSFD